MSSQSQTYYGKICPFCNFHCLLDGQLYDHLVMAHKDPLKQRFYEAGEVVKLDEKISLELPRSDATFSLKLCSACVTRLVMNPPKSPFTNKISGWSRYLVLICPDCKKQTFG